MTTEDPHALTGAYALDALGPDEHHAFTRHLGQCTSCAQEVREFAATAARLASAAAVPPPPELKALVLERIDSVRQLPPRVPAPGRYAVLAAGIRRRGAVLVIAASLAAAVSFGAIALGQHGEAQRARRAVQAAQREADRAGARSEALTAVLAAPDARTATGRTASGARVTVVTSAARDQAVVLAAQLPPPPAGTTYQLWFSEHGSMRPAGLLGGGHALLLDGAVRDATAIGLTVEPAGGSARPTTAPLLVMALPA
ncbi:anti-sigma factor [Streptomyces sp. NBC_00536]|uniref:anti-sigma factor n=1 Tax=Streptomyces sp. NBC_00536 TaxID=2975769 RepID=UPI002E80D34E|nr:anti-sigma factor [Streptomyces sp. NBC_00536]WUC79985.1 anti-sigma factor [Streptomyces sp. NBC_00536]